MKKKVLILGITLMMALPVLGLAAQAPAAPEMTAAASGRRMGGRWNQSAPQTTQAAPQVNFVDADNDGVCDVCGNVPGANAQAPGFVDANGDGVCDHFGTAQQHQGGQQGQKQAGGRGFGKSQGGQGRHQNAQPNGQERNRR